MATTLVDADGQRQSQKDLSKGSTRPSTWYGYAAFLLALPYPLLMLHRALGGTLGLAAPGAAGEG